MVEETIGLEGCCVVYSGFPCICLLLHGEQAVVPDGVPNIA